MAANGIRVISIDEKPGIQALERDAATQPAKEGKMEHQEFNYTRHGTQCLIAAQDVATGTITHSYVGDTRKEVDFTRFIKDLLAQNPEGEWYLVMDNLNTHRSESLVKLIAKHEGIEEDLGIKGKEGILKSMKTRSEWLSSQERRIRIMYTPIHCSWMNPVEGWFSQLVRRLLARAQYDSKDALRNSILKFIKQFNSFWAKPISWSFMGKPLTSC
jgi:putative transposase